MEPTWTTKSAALLAELTVLCLLSAQNFPAPVARHQEPALSSTKRNPFEAIPEARQASPARLSGPTIAAIEFRGARRILQSALRAEIFSRAGDAYDVEALQRDTQALYNTGRFAHVAWEAEPGPTGATVRFVFFEGPLIESIDYPGNSTVTIEEEVLERLQLRNSWPRRDAATSQSPLWSSESGRHPLQGSPSRLRTGQQRSDNVHCGPVQRRKLPEGKKSSPETTLSSGLNGD